MSQFNRRDFSKLAISAPWALSLPESTPLPYAGGLTDLEGLQVGHVTLTERPTGCTVVLAPEGAVAGVDVRGSAPGTRETDLLEPGRLVEKIHAVVLSGGSAFGLDAASGVMRFLKEKGVGYTMGSGTVPIVPAAVLFDLGVGDRPANPGPEEGYRACREANRGPVAEGSVGAGAGATVGKLLGTRSAMKGGLGSFAIRVGDLIVAGLAAVNAVGDVVDPDSGKILAGARRPDGSFADLSRMLRTLPISSFRTANENTTLGVVATNAVFDKAGMRKMAQMAHDGLARAIRPVHLPWDGDTVFSLSTGRLEGENLGQVGALAADVMAGAVVRAIRQARGLPGYPAHGELP